MYAQLGNIIFDGLNGFDSLERSRETEYAEHALIDGKPRLQRIGEKLETISFSLTLHINFTDPQERINELDEARINGDVLPLLNGGGDYLGNYVIRRMAESTQQLGPDGKLLWATLNVELSEYAEENPINLKQQNAKRQALALADNFESPTAVAPLKPVAVSLATPSAVVSNTAQAANIEAAQIDADLKNAAANPTASATLYDRTSKRLRAMDENLSKANQQITNSLNSTTQFNNFVTQISNVRSKLAILKTYVDARSLNDIANANVDLQNEIRRLNTASAPFAMQVALRK